ncbi:hypothetical protein N7540_006733 [Penicillium herquei]|nr:hypothetical protein N7540_006733 [Penicillium herquei]
MTREHHNDLSLISDSMSANKTRPRDTADSNTISGEQGTPDGDYDWAEAKNSTSVENYSDREKLIQQTLAVDGLNKLIESNIDRSKISEPSLTA